MQFKSFLNKNNNDYKPKELEMVSEFIKNGENILSENTFKVESISNTVQEKLEQIDLTKENLVQEVSEAKNNLYVFQDELSNKIDTAIENLGKTKSGEKGEKGDPGKDGITPDISGLKEEILSEIKIPEIKPISGEEVIDKINNLPLEDDNKIDWSRIKNAPKAENKIVGSPTVISNAVDLDSSTRQNNYAIVWDATNSRYRHNPVGSGTVTNVSVATANGISGTVTNPTTTPEITLDITALNATKIANGSVSNTEFQYLDGVTSNIQTQINNKFTLPSLTAGSVLFSDGTTIAQDNTNFFWDDANNRLGLGSASPSARLHVGGNISTTSWTTTSPLLNVASTALTDTTGSGTIASRGAVTLGTPVYAASNVQTISDAYNLIVNAPSASTNTTITRNHALFANGNVKVNGVMSLSGSNIDLNTVLNCGGNITDPAAATNGANFSRTLVLTAAGSQIITGGVFNISTSANAFNQTGLIKGGFFSVQNSNTATVSDARAGHSLLYNVGAGTISSGYGFKSDIQNLNASGIIGSAYGSHVSVVFNNGTLTNTYGYYVGDITSGTQTNQAYAFYNSDTNARNYFAGRTGIEVTAPTAMLHLKAGTASANTAPLKFTSGTLMTTPEAGAKEFLTDDFYGTITTGAARKIFAWTPTQTDVTASRALNTTYTAPATRSIMVVATVRCVISLAAGTAYVQGKSDGSTPPTTVASGITGIEAGLVGEDNSFQISFVVAAGQKYRIDSTAVNGTVTLGKWFEVAY